MADEDSSSDSELEAGVFKVERILAERLVDGEPKYLIRWDGYIEEDSTWEPEENIQDPAILNQWSIIRGEEQSGLRPVFDVADFERRQAKKVKEEARLLRIKNKRRGIQVSPHTSDEDSESSEAIEDPAIPEGLFVGNNHKPKKKRRLLMEPATGYTGIARPVVKATPVANLSRTTSTSSVPRRQNTGPRVAKDALEPAARMVAAAPRNVFQSREVPPKKPKATLMESSTNPKNAPKVYPNMRIGNMAAKQAKNLADRAPDLEAIGGVFKPDEIARIRRMQPVQLGQQLSRAPEQSSASREPQGQEQESRVPEHVGPRPGYRMLHGNRAICAYYYDNTGCKNEFCKFVHEDRPDLPVAPYKFEIPCYHFQDDKCVRGDKCEYIHKKVPRDAIIASSALNKDSSFGTAAAVAPMGDAPYKPFDKSRTVCYFWDLNKDCRSGSNCQYAHKYEDVDSIAPAPAGHHFSNKVIDKSRTACFFWYEYKECRLGSSCQFAHKYEPGFEIAQPPRGHVSSHNTEPDHYEDQMMFLQTPDQGNSPAPIVPIPVAPVAPMATAMAPIVTMAPAPQVLRPASTTKLTLEQYKAKKAAESSGDILASVETSVTGKPPAKQRNFKAFFANEEITLDFGDMNERELEKPWGKCFLGLSDIRFDSMCVAKDFAARYNELKSQYYWRGDVTSPSKSNKERLEILGKQLRDTLPGGVISVHKDLTILIHPTSEAWNFLFKGLPNLPTSQCALRYLIFKPKSNVALAHTLESTADTAEGSVLETSRAIRPTLVSKIHNLDFGRLFHKLDQKQTCYAYLLFPRHANKMAKWLYYWIRTCHQGNAKIYSSEKSGDWDAFVKSSMSDSGSVLIHEDCIQEVSLLPSLMDLIMQKAPRKNFSFWYFAGDDTVQSPTYPYDIDRTIGQTTAIRLFSVGGAVLVTPSFLVAEPERALQLLNWFKAEKLEKAEKALPNSWKLIMPHGARQFLEQVANAKADERVRFMETYDGKPIKDALQEELGLSWKTCNDRFSLSRLVRVLDTFDITGEPSDLNTYKPIITMPESWGWEDEEKMGNYFAGWSFYSMNKYRKFVIAGTSLKSERRSYWWKEARIIFDEATGLVAHEGLELPPGKGASAFGSVAAQIDYPSAGTATSPSEKRVSTPAEIRHANFEVAKVLTSPGRKTQQFLSGRPITTHGMRILETKGDLVRVPEVPQLKLGEMWLKEVVLTPTTVWFDAARTAGTLEGNGKTWEHIHLGDWQSCFKHLSIDANKYTEAIC